MTWHTVTVAKGLEICTPGRPSGCIWLWYRSYINTCESPNCMHISISSFRRWPLWHCSQVCPLCRASTALAATVFRVKAVPVNRVGSLKIEAFQPGAALYMCYCITCIIDSCCCTSHFGTRESDAKVGHTALNISNDRVPSFPGSSSSNSHNNNKKQHSQLCNTTIQPYNAFTLIGHKVRT